MELFKQLLSAQLAAHPAMEVRDVVKLCYQAANGAEHLLEDLSGAERYFYEEYEAVSVSDEPLFERISEQVYRANLGAWKREQLPPELLFRMFTGTVFQSAGPERLRAYLTAAEEVLRGCGFPMEAWAEFLTDYIARGLPPVRHSEAYRAAEHPAYRIVHADRVQEMKDGRET